MLLALNELAVYLASEVPGINADAVSFSSQWPKLVNTNFEQSPDIKCSLFRKQFTRDDFSKTLQELGLTPSAVSHYL